jgi:hypothetical protein
MGCGQRVSRPAHANPHPGGAAPAALYCRAYRRTCNRTVTGPCQVRNLFPKSQ